MIISQFQTLKKKNINFVSFCRQFVGVETCATVVTDWSPRMRKYKSVISLGFCIICYVIGLAHITQVIILMVVIVSHLKRITETWTLEIRLMLTRFQFYMKGESSQSQFAVR